MTVMTEVAEMIGSDTGISPQDWLLLWCMEHTDADEDSIRRATGRTQAQLAELRDSNPQALSEIRSLHELGALLSLDRLFELLRQRLGMMLATATKPAEMRSLLGSLRQLPGAKTLLKQADAGCDRSPEATSIADLQAEVLSNAPSRQQLRAMERKMLKALGK